MPHDHHDHDHDHLSPSGHPYRQDNDEPLTYWQLMEISVRELMIEKGKFSAPEINKQIDLIHGPIGINLGGKSASEIALSIISQLVLITNN